MALYSEQFLDQIKAKINIVDLISTYIPISRQGRDYWACCPFHNEKTPSFQIKEDQQCYRCYGCGKNGNIFTFVMEYEKVSFPESIEVLAKKAGLELPQLTDDPQYNLRKQQLEKIYSINKEAAKFYHDNLKKEEAIIARDYLAKREINLETIMKFGMGYSTDFNSLIDYLLKKGYDKTTLVFSGIAGKNENGDVYDFFGKRLIIPIIDSGGKVIGFTGRDLDPKPDFAKYKNTSATLAFNKRKNLFGINLFKKHKQGKVRTMILVEGHMDVISLYQYGFTNAVASMGTSLTPEQCREIKRYTDIVFVSFDGDSAGQEATLRGLELLKEEGLEVKVVCLSDNLDPDDYVKKYGKAGYEKLIIDALPLIDFKLKKVEEKHTFNSYDNKLKYAREAIKVLSGLDSVEREVYVDLVSARCGLSKETILKKVENDDSDTPPPIVKEKVEVKTSGLNIGARFVLASMFFAKDFALYTDCDTNLFEDPKHKLICEYIQRCAKNNQVPHSSKLYDILENDQEAQEIALALDDVMEQNQSVFYKQSVANLRNNYITKERKRLVAELQEETDTDKKKMIVNQINNLTKPQAKY